MSYLTNSIVLLYSPWRDLVPRTYLKETEFSDLLTKKS